jgi:amphi-Trp domain-containing protein
METGKIEVKQTLPYKEAVRYLEDLVASLKEGTIVVSREQEHVTLTPAETVGIELSAKTKKGKAKFSLELSWAEECASAAERQPAAGKAAPKKTATKKAGPKKAAARKAPAKRGK